MTNLNPFPTATHISDDDTAPLLNKRNIIVLTINLSSEVHDEDFHYSRLIAGFVQNNNNKSLPISIYDLNLEPLLFSHLFLNGKEYFYDLKKNA